MDNLKKYIAVEQRAFNRLKNASAEGIKNWAYLDTTGHLTMGIGHNLQTSDEFDSARSEFLALPWNKTISGSSRLRPATMEEKEQAFAKLKKAASSAKSFNVKAEHYKPLTSLVLSQPDIEHLLQQDIRAKLHDVVGVIKNFDTLTPDQQDVALDLAFKAGGVGNKFKDAAKILDAKGMAEESLVSTGEINGRKTRNWQRVIENYRKAAGVSREEAVKGLAEYFKDRQHEEHFIPDEIKREINKSSAPKTKCQSPVNVSGYQRGNVQVDKYERSCPQR